ncbi:MULTISPECIES: FmdB family zinc ribbon protein [unclassified Streptomyces]|uniref:FmdB family zinc ribbon protein n=1 Tax=unclassified Streptomyces TaxID=2593676 RepID=UPI000A8AFDCC|nr:MULTISPECIES: zinc ribbon domain-containing protein [unclassified Streptomyces]MYS23548.1 zinc ribbon domain-containing protein [Streptomyces sp. SID4948]
MPRYEYRCKSCGATFEMRRPMSQANAAAPPCPQGHDDTVKLLSTVSVGASSSSSSAASSAPAPASGGGGGCCGGGCCS